MNNKKAMKKSMVITTVVMALLLIVALSTATFAWYTANSNVAVTPTTVTSASSNSANLVIDNQAATSVSATGSSVDLTMNDTNGSVPMVYAGTAPTATTTYKAFTESFYTFTQDANGYFASVPTDATPAAISTVSGTAASSNVIYLTNVGDKKATIKVVVKINPYKEVTTVTAGDDVSKYYTKDENDVYTAATGNAVAGTTYYVKNDNLRVAVFAGEIGETVPADDDLTLVGIYGDSAMQIAPATITDATTSDKISTIITDTYSDLKTSGTELTLQSDVEGMVAVKVRVVAWFEGDGMTNALAGTASEFSMSFSA